MSSHAIVRFSSSSAEEQYYLPAEKLIIGNPRQSLWKRYTDRSGKFFAGIWASEIGKWHVNYTEEEYCRILEGESVITDAAGKAMTVKVGDEFVIPAGFVGTWEVVLPTRKTYVIYEG
ncbi:MAG TPA: cupin domain-containing protein [Burkholderiaceae bacterium]